MMPALSGSSSRASRLAAAIATIEELAGDVSASHKSGGPGDQSRLRGGSVSPTPARAGARKLSRIERLVEQYAAEADAQSRVKKSAVVAVKPASCRPWSAIDNASRLASFAHISNWFGKPELVSPLQCSRFGWRLASRDTLACDSCGARLAFPSSMASGLSASSLLELAQRLRLRLFDSHAPLCPWRATPCPARFAAIVLPPPLSFLTLLRRRVELMSRAFSEVVRLDPSVVNDVVSALSTAALTVSTAASDGAAATATLTSSVVQQQQVRMSSAEETLAGIVVLVLQELQGSGGMLSLGTRRHSSDYKAAVVTDADAPAADSALTQSRSPAHVLDVVGEEEALTGSCTAAAAAFFTLAPSSASAASHDAPSHLLLRRALFECATPPRAAAALAALAGWSVADGDDGVSSSSNSSSSSVRDRGTASASRRKDDGSSSSSGNPLLRTPSTPVSPASVAGVGGKRPRDAGDGASRAITLGCDLCGKRVTLCGGGGVGAVGSPRRARVIANNTPSASCVAVSTPSASASFVDHHAAPSSSPTAAVAAAVAVSSPSSAAAAAAPSARRTSTSFSVLGAARAALAAASRADVVIRGGTEEAPPIAAAPAAATSQAATAVNAASVTPTMLDTTSSSSTDAGMPTPSLSLSSAAAAAAAASSSEVEVVAFHPLKAHFWFCPWARPSAKVPSEALSGMVAALQRQQQRRHGQRQSLTLQSTDSTSSGSSTSRSDGGISASSSAAHAVTFALVALSRASLGLSDVDFIAGMLASSSSSSRGGGRSAAAAATHVGDAGAGSPSVGPSSSAAAAGLSLSAVQHQQRERFEHVGTEAAVADFDSVDSIVESWAAATVRTGDVRDANTAVTVSAAAAAAPVLGGGVAASQRPPSSAASAKVPVPGWLLAALYLWALVPRVTV